jgi:nucleotide-binding universal stress UspA family protein
VIARQQPAAAITVILGPTDGSPCSDKAVSFAGSLARQLPANVHVLFAAETRYAGLWYYHVLGDIIVDRIRKKGQSAADDSAEELRDLGVSDVQAHMQEGHPGEVIREMAVKLDASLIVMGTHGHEGSSGAHWKRRTRGGRYVHCSPHSRQVGAWC